MIEKALLDLGEIDKTQVALAGGKGANLGELSRIEGINVPAGFCITTDAYKRITEKNEQFNRLLDDLSQLTTYQREDINAISATIRNTIESIPIPADMVEEIMRHLERSGSHDA